MGIIFKKTVRWWEDGSATLYARLIAPDGTGALQSDGSRLIKVADLAVATGLALKVFDTGTSPSVETHTVAHVVSDVLDDTLATNWGEDSVGYNYSYLVPATAFPNGGKTYLAELRIETTGGGVGYVQWEGPAENVHRS
jgi:hypothetical protein